jgi:hypothetical protein
MPPEQQNRCKYGKDTIKDRIKNKGTKKESQESLCKEEAAPTGRPAA